MTTVVAVLTDDELIVGADSKVSWQQNADAGEPTACKIHQVGNRFFSYAGLAGDLVSGFRVSETARNAILSSKTFREIPGLFASMVQIPLSQQFRMLQTTHPALHSQLMQGGGPLDIIFLGYENNELNLYKQLYTGTHIESAGYRPMKDGPAVIILGYGQPLGALIEADKRFWDVGIPVAVHNLLDIAIQENPESVGPPIYILRIDKEGAEWIEKAPHCPGIQPY